VSNIPRHGRFFAARFNALVVVPSIGLLLFAGICCGTVFRLAAERAAAVKQAAARADTLAKAFEQWSIRNLATFDQMASFVKYEYESNGKTDSLAEDIRQARLPNAALVLTSLVDERGDIIASSHSSPAQVNVSDREHFKFHQHQDSGKANISVPLIGRLSGAWTIQLTRRLNHRDGTFAGMVSIAIAPSTFTDYYDGADLGRDGLLAVIGADGITRAWRAGSDVRQGASLDLAAFRQSLQAARAHDMPLASPVDGRIRYASMRDLKDYPLAVEVGLSEDEALADYYRKRRLYLAAAVLALALLSASFSLATFFMWRLKRSAAEMHYLSRFDALTGLPNRAAFHLDLASAIAGAVPTSQVAVLFIDLDNFKTVNDSLGHAEGDALLKLVAAALKRVVRPDDVVCRLGGDEFTIILRNVSDRAAASVVAERVLEVLSVPLSVGERWISTNASIGISLSPEHAADAGAALVAADLAMYQAKSGGKNRLAFFRPEDGAAAAERLELEAAVRHGLANGEFFLQYQPKVDACSGSVTGFEALIRWNHPRRGIVHPGAFISIAEASGLILPMGRLVLEMACRQMRRWHDDGMGWIRVAINVSAEQFKRSNLVEDIRGALSRHDVPADALELELTESLLMEDPDAARATLRQLQAMGIRIAMDDFGVGHSSLSLLRIFKVDVLKIDGSFVKEVPANEETAVLIRAVVTMARAMRMKIVAEGVETEAQRRFLVEAGCDVLQGFLFGKAVGADAVPDLLGKLFVGAPGARVPDSQQVDKLDGAVESRVEPMV
jgi:diguanylate cyclase (GGDEF)-like protein